LSHSSWENVERDVSKRIAQCHGLRNVERVGGTGRLWESRENNIHAFEWIHGHDKRRASRRT
jgi:hypothetical protein